MSFFVTHVFDVVGQCIYPNSLHFGLKISTESILGKNSLSFSLSLLQALFLPNVVEFLVETPFFLAGVKLKLLG